MARRAPDGDRGVRTGLVIRTLYVRLSELRAARLSSVELCRRLDYEGWAHLHHSADAPLFLLGPLGSPSLARRVLGDYLEDAETAVVLPAPPGVEAVDAVLSSDGVRCAAAPARRALKRQTAAVWTVALPERRGRWRVHFLPPVAPVDGDTEASLTQRYLSALEEMIRRYPACWPWRDS